MAEEEVKKEFDPKRDRRAVKKLGDWVRGLKPDPVLEQVPKKQERQQDSRDDAKD